MAFRAIRTCQSLTTTYPGLFSRSYATAATAALAEIPVPVQRPKPFQLLTKSHIKPLFERYAPQLDHVSYLAAAQVFPMRVNNHVVEDLIDWYVHLLFELGNGFQCMTSGHPNS